MLDVGLINGTVVAETGCDALDLGLKDGKIAEIERPGALAPARRTIDAAGMYVIPGAIDIHFHCRAPSHPERGDFRSETAAAVGAGVTTVFEMPISLPACSSPEVLARRRALAEAEAYANVALYSGAVLGGEAATVAMVEAGAIAFKLFTTSPPAGREAEFEGLWACEEADIYEALADIAETGLRCVVHAENQSLLRYFQRTSPPDLVWWPPLVESATIGMLAGVALELGSPLHIAHVSSEQALAIVRGALLAGAPLSAETCPQYLTLDESTVAVFGAVAKVAPPLRRRSDADALWRGLVDGSLSVVASDHSPFLLAEKTTADFAQAPRGLPTVELLVPVVFDAVARGVITLERAVELVSGNPARLFGLYPEKGTIALGSDADLTVVSLERTFTPSPATLRSRAADCGVVYAGLSLQAVVDTTIVGGAVVFAGSRICAEPAGRFVPGPGLGSLNPVR